MPAVSLPTFQGKSANIEGKAEQLAAFLADPNDPIMVARMGRETVVRAESNLTVLRGERYRNQEGWVQGWRYLRHDNSGSIVAALNVTQLCQNRRVAVVASNVFVAPRLRRQGLASGLLRTALSDHPTLCADTSMSEAGAALVGQRKALPVLPRRALLDTVRASFPKSSR